MIILGYVVLDKNMLCSAGPWVCGKYRNKKT